MVNGFRHGFKLGHVGDPADVEAKNSKKAAEHPEVIDKKLESEVAKGRIAGPFKEKPFQHFQVSPLSVREKSVKGTYRLIHDLTYPYDETSVNSRIPQSAKEVQYSTVRDAIKELSSLPPGAFLAKCDIADAYRLIPVHPSEYPKLGMKWRGSYYFDKFLPQGCGSSCRIFEEFSTALQAIFKYYNKNSYVQHMIDDFLFIAITREGCQKLLDSFTDLCVDIGVPLAPGKTTSPNSWIIFLGIKLDSVARCASLPEDKVINYSMEIEEHLDRKRLTRKQLESVVGRLNFAAAVVPARPFLYRLSKMIYTVDKPYHYVKVSKEMRRDLETWHKFLHNYNGITFFRSLKVIPSDAINMASDASFKGLGGCYGSSWVQARYPESWKSYGIQVLEMFPVYVLIATFGHLLRNSSIRYQCDNEAVVAIINAQSSKCPRIMQIVRPLTLLLIRHNIYLTALHIPGLKNILPDRISRFQVTKELLRSYGMKEQPTPIPLHARPEYFEIS